MSPVVPALAAGTQAQLAGGIGLVAVAIVVAILGYLRPRLGLALAIAFVARAGAALFNFYVAPLPDGTADAVTFERLAWEWSQGGLKGTMAHFTGIDAHFYAWLMSLVYAVVGRSLLLLQALSVLIGVLGVWAAWRLAREVWGDRAAEKAAWVIAVFPAVVMYGALPMREAYALFFATAGMVWVVRWGRTDDWRSAAKATIFFGMAAFFHGGVFVGILGLFGAVMLRKTRQSLADLPAGRARALGAFVGIVVVLGLVIGFAVSGISVQKLGTAAQLFSAERWMHYFESRAYGAGRYPEWTQPSGHGDFIWAVPLRAVYLLFSPLPWDIRTPAHLIGLADGLLYLAIVAVAVRHGRLLMRDPGTRVGLMVVGALLLAFGVGTGNFGAALRHRAKFTAILVAIVAAWIPRFVWQKNVDGQPKDGTWRAHRGMASRDPSEVGRRTFR